MGFSKAARLLGAALPCLIAWCQPALAAGTPAAAAPAASAPGAPSRLEDYYLLALSVSEGVAVLRTPDRQLITLRTGSTLPAAKARLVQVLGDRLRFDTADEQGQRQTAWMIRAASPDQPPQVQRVSSIGPARPTAVGNGPAIAVPLGAASASK